MAKTQRVEVWPCGPVAKCSVPWCRQGATKILRFLDSQGRFYRQREVCESHARELWAGTKAIDRTDREMTGMSFKPFTEPCNELAAAQRTFLKTELGFRDMGVLRFERGKLAKDTLSAIWGFCSDKKFVGDDGREYVIAKGGQKAETKNVLDLTLKIEGSDRALAKYALLLIDIS
jgi:hypothetical protein